MYNQYYNFLNKVKISVLGSSLTEDHHYYS